MHRALFKRLFVRLSVLWALMAFTFAPMAVVASDTPLVVIRFNQPRVYFEQPLFTALSRALEIKPDVRFNLISFVPVRDNAEAEAERHVASIVAAMVKMGIPQSNISVAREMAGEIRHDEVHIFVY